MIKKAQQGNTVWLAITNSYKRIVRKPARHDGKYLRGLNFKGLTPEEINIMNIINRYDPNISSPVTRFLPREPGTFWLDRGNMVWEVDDEGVLSCYGKKWLPADRAPFTKVM